MDDWSVFVIPEGVGPVLPTVGSVKWIPGARWQFAKLPVPGPGAERLVDWHGQPQAPWWWAD